MKQCNEWKRDGYETAPALLKKTHRGKKRAVEEDMA